MQDGNPDLGGHHSSTRLRDGCMPLLSCQLQIRLGGYYARQREAAASSACAYCEGDLGAAGARATSVTARDLPEWREFTFRPATRFDVTVETAAGTYRVLVTEALPENWEDGDFPRPPEEISTPVVESADMVR